MIIAYKQGQDILKNGEKHIAFAINTEGINYSGFAGIISSKYWPELANICGGCKLGTVLTKSVDGVTFHALVCHSLEENGWQHQTETIRKCFDAIETDEPIASISIGTGLLGVLGGANFRWIKKGMELSKKKIILY